MWGDDLSTDTESVKNQEEQGLEQEPYSAASLETCAPHSTLVK